MIIKILIVIIVLLYLHLLYKSKNNSDHDHELELEHFVIPTDTTPDPDPSTLVKDKWGPLSIWDQRPPVYNQNWNKVWMAPQVSSNADQVQDIPHSNEHSTPVGYSLVNMFTGDQVNQIVSACMDQVKTGTYIPAIINPKKIEQFNKESWKNRYNLYDPERLSNIYPIHKYPIEIINKILHRFIKRINYHMRSQFPQNIKKYGYIPFQIYKYKLVNVEEDDKKGRRYSLIVVFLRDVNVSRGFTYFLQVVKPYKSKPTEFYFQNYDMIGIFYNYRFMLLPGTSELKNTYKSLLKPDHAIIPTSEVINKFLENRYYQMEGDDLVNQYSCFNRNPRSASDQFINANNKQNCEDRYNFYGKPKPVGYWDRPCKKDSECPFYKANKNYENNFGKCRNGYCQMPVGVKPLGYHKYFDNSKALCYNCNSTTWKDTTTLGSCCNEQKDKSKYPFLDGPDYAYQNDVFQRIQKGLKKRGCYTKFEYKNIFSNDIVNRTLHCPKV